MNTCLNEFIITSSPWKASCWSLSHLYEGLENIQVYHRGSVVEATVNSIITHFWTILELWGVLLWWLCTLVLWCFIENCVCFRDNPHLLGMLWASLENLIRRPWTSMPMLKAIRRSRPLGLLFLGSMSEMARRAGSTAPDGWVAGCQVSSKSMEWTWGTPFNQWLLLSCFNYIVSRRYLLFFSWQCKLSARHSSEVCQLHYKGPDVAVFSSLTITHDWINTWPQ